MLERRARRDDRRPADLPGAARQPALRRAAAGAARRLRAARHRRGALRVRLGFRLPPRLPAPDQDAARAGTGHARARHHGDGQRPGHRGRRRPARRRHRRRCADRLARTSLRLGVVPRLDGVQRAAWVADALDRLPGSGIVYVLTVAETERLAGLLHELRARGRRLLLGRRHRRAGSPRGSPAPQRGQSPRRHVGARHGLRQAGPRVLHPRRLARVAGRLLPAGRARRAGARRRRRRAAAGGSGRTGVGVLRHVGNPGARARRRRCSPHSTAGRRRCRRSNRRRSCAAAASRRCSRSSPSTAWSPAGADGWTATGTPWTYDAAKWRALRRVRETPRPT